MNILEIHVLLNSCLNSSTGLIITIMIIIIIIEIIKALILCYISTWLIEALQFKNTKTT